MKRHYQLLFQMCSSSARTLTCTYTLTRHTVWEHTSAPSAQSPCFYSLPENMVIGFEEGETQRNTDVRGKRRLVASHISPSQGPDLQPRYVS